MPLLWLFLAFLAGILLAAILGLATGVWLALAGTAMLAFILPRLLRRSWIRSPVDHSAGVAGPSTGWPVPPLPCSLLLVSLALGGARYQAAQPRLEPDFIAYYNDAGRVVLEGVVARPADRREAYTNLRLAVERLRRGAEQPYTPVRGQLLVRLAGQAGWRYGDLLRLHGRLVTPSEFEGFSYRDYLACQGVYSYLQATQVELIQQGEGNPLLALVYALKERALDVVYRLYPDPEASLLAGILLGVEGGISQRLREAFQDTGTAHIIAISGFNIAIVAGLFASLFGRLLRPRRAALAAAAAIAAYTLLVGAEPSVVRAAIIGGLGLFARQVGRRQDGLNSLAIAAGVMALFNPQILWDVGFQLSFTATLGLVLYAAPLSQAFTRLASRFLPPATVERLAGPVGAYLLFTLAAQLTSLPVTIYYFGRFSLSSLLANPLILPAQPAVMVLGGLATLLGLVYLPLGQAAALLAWPFVAYTIRVVELFARFPGGVVALGGIGLLAVGLYYAILLPLTLAWPRLRQLAVAWGLARRDLLAAGSLAIIGVVSALVWKAALSAPDGLLHLTVFDVPPPTGSGRPSGEALLVQTPGGRYLLIDGGPSQRALSDALGRWLPPFNRRLDFLVVAAPGEGQVAALPSLLERSLPGQVLWAGASTAGYSARLLREGLVSAGVPIIPAQQGQRLDLGSGAGLQVLAVGRRGAVLLLEWGRFRALLPIGMDFESLEALIEDPGLGPVSALLLAEGGYAPANPPEWIARLQPQVVLLSVGAGDKDGLPSPETLQAVEGYTLLRTDQNGWIELTTDGEQMWVEAERQ